MAGSTRDQEQLRHQSCPDLGADALFGSSGVSGRSSPPQCQMDAVTATRRCNRPAHGRGFAIPPTTPTSCFGSCSGEAHHTVLRSRSRVDYDDPHEPQRATLGTTPVGLNLLVAPPQHCRDNGCRLRHDEQKFSEGAPLLYRQHEALRQEADRCQSDSIGDGIITPAPPGFGNGFTTSYPPRGGASGGASSAFSGSTSSSDRDTVEHHRLDGRTASGSGRLRPISAPAGSDDGGGVNPSVVTPPRTAPSTAVSTPTNPQQWLENFSLRLSTSASGVGAAALESPSPSVLPLASNSRTSTLGGVDGGSVTSAAAGEAASPGLTDSLLPRVECRAAAAGACPAADCPANGDCLPGATAEMLVYEVNFKRATRTFLPAENLDHKSILCGTLMKVSDVRMLLIYCCEGSQVVFAANI